MLAYPHGPTHRPTLTCNTPAEWSLLISKAQTGALPTPTPGTISDLVSNTAMPSPHAKNGPAQAPTDVIHIMMRWQGRWVCEWDQRQQSAICIAYTARMHTSQGWVIWKQ